MRRAVYAAAAGACAAGAARLAYSAMNRRPPGGPKAWSRTNHRGEPVTLLEGPAVAAGALAGVLAQGIPAALAAAAGSPGAQSGRRAAALALGGAGAAAFGAYDDLAGSGDRRGFRGHLGALRHGEVTTGAVKLGGIGATGIISAALAGGSPADVILNAGLVAGGANLLNLFDLRPGRAIKVAAASGVLLGAAGQRRRGRTAGRRAGAAPRGPERAGDARRRRRERARRDARRIGRRAVPAGSDGAARRDRRADRGEREGQLHQGDRAHPRAELAGHARPSATRRSRPHRSRPWSRSLLSRPNQRSDRARSRAGECSAAGRGDRPRRADDRRHHDAGAGHRVRPPGGVRAYRPGVVRGHRVHHGEHGAEHHLRHRDGRCPHRGRGAGAGRPGTG